MRVGIWTFLHLLGMAMWLGGMATLGIWTSRARATGDPKIVAFAYATARRLYRGIVSAGAWLTIAAGVILVFETDRSWFRPFPDHWLFQMQVVGIAAFLVTVLYVVPQAGTLARLAEGAAGEGANSPEFARRVKRQAIVGGVLGAVLIYVVLLGALRF